MTKEETEACLRYVIENFHPIDIIELIGYLSHPDDDEDENLTIAKRFSSYIDDFKKACSLYQETGELCRNCKMKEEFLLNWLRAILDHTRTT